MADLFKTRYHRDGTVTVWDVYSQRWLRTGSPDADTLASLSPKERARVIRHTEKKQNPASIRAQVRRLPSGQIQLKIPIGRSENPHDVIDQLKKLFGKRVKAVEMVRPKAVRKVRKSTLKRKR